MNVAADQAEAVGDDKILLVNLAEEGVIPETLESLGGELAPVVGAL